MIDVLLTHSYRLANDAKQLRKMQPYAPLGTLYAATALRNAGIRVAVFDTTLRSPVAELASVLRSQRPSIVVIYEDDFNFLSKMCLSSMRETSREICAMAREAGTTVIVHGSDATDHSGDYLDAGADYVLVGEAEETLATLCGNLMRHENVDAIPGVVRRDAAGHVVRSLTGGAKNKTWNQTRGIARELIDLEPYRHAWKGAHGYYSANIVASRGCPFHCNWCAKPISGNSFQLRAAEDVVSEMRELKDLYGVEHLWFSDDVFALDRRWVEEFAAAVEREGCSLPFKIQSRADLMTESTVDALRRAGCAEVWMGVESGSQKILDAMDKGLKLSAVHKARKLLASAGIRACFFLQFGYPGEAWHEIEETLRLVREVRPDDIGVSLSYPLPGTVFYDRVEAQLGSKKHWNDSDDLCVTFTAAYTTEFYVALRDALHLEVTSWSKHESAPEVRTAWENLRSMELHSRNAYVTKLETSHPVGAPRSGGFIPLQQFSGGHA